MSVRLPLLYLLLLVLVLLFFSPSPSLSLPPPPLSLSVSLSLSLSIYLSRCLTVYHALFFTPCRYLLFSLPPPPPPPTHPPSLLNLDSFPFLMSSTTRKTHSNVVVTAIELKLPVHFFGYREVYLKPEFDVRMRRALFRTALPVYPEAIVPVQVPVRRGR